MFSLGLQSISKILFGLIVFGIIDLECGVSITGFAGMYLAITLIMHLVNSTNNNAASLNFKKPKRVKT